MGRADLAFSRGLDGGGFGRLVGVIFGSEEGILVVVERLRGFGELVVGGGVVKRLVELGCCGSGFMGCGNGSCSSRGRDIFFGFLRWFLMVMMMMVLVFCDNGHVNYFVVLDVGGERVVSDYFVAGSAGDSDVGLISAKFTSDVIEMLPNVWICESRSLDRFFFLFVISTALSGLSLRFEFDFGEEIGEFVFLR